MRFLCDIFPTPRRSVTWRNALPLFVFLIAYAALCLYLELSNTLLFAEPMAFVLMVFAPWVWWMQVAGYSGLSRARGTFSFLIRMSMLGIFVILMAEPRAVRTSDVLSVVYAVDISDSIGDTSTEKALEFVANTARDKPPADEAGLVVFGRNAAVELPPKTAFPYEAINVRISRDATDLQQSLSLAAATLPEENRGRIVLISDGTETEGRLAEIIGDLQGRGIAVDVLPIQYDYDDEVWVERLELPQFVKIGDNYEAAVVLSSLRDGKGRLVLSENGEEILEEEVVYQAGKNRYTIPIKLREPGYYEYTATIEVDSGKDNLRQNNSVMNYIFVKGEGKVLLVTDPAGDERDVKSFAKAVRQSKRLVDVMPAYDFPRDSLSLMPYDCIVFVNAPADAFDTVQLKAVHDAVYHQGIGFLMIGGANSFGPGGYHRTVIEEALPVSMDITKKKVLPKGALAIILHTCEFPEGNTWGKRITKQAIKVLGAQDEVGVLAYDSMNGEGWLFELTPAGEYNKLVPKINAAQIGDMPSFARTMRLGLEGLKASDASAKHMIIISDGDPQPPSPKLVSQFKDAQISVSMVAMFPHGGADISKMRAISAVTGGRYYFPADPALLPSIFIKESKTLKRSMIQNRSFLPQLEMNSSILKGIDAIPQLHGYVLTTAKDKALTILRVPPEKEGDDELDPVLSTWRYGLGSTAAFTSDLSANWGKDWVDWDKYQAFVKQLMTNVSRVGKKGHLRLYTYTSGNEGVILVEDFHPEEAFLEIYARVAGPRERTESIPLKQIGPRRYQANVPLWGKGRYQVMAVGKAGEREDRIVGGLIVPYSPEYLKFRSSPIALENVARKTGGQELTADATSASIFNRRAPKQSSRPIFDWFLVALACMVPVDVGVRRIQIDFNAIKNWLGLGQQAGPSTETMGTLLDRKQAIGSQLERRSDEQSLPEERPLAVSTANRPRRTALKSTTEKTAEKPQPKSESPPKDISSMSTTERLLALKKKRQDQDQNDD